MIKPKVEQVWWVSISKNKHTPLIKRRVVDISSKMVILSDPCLKIPNNMSKAYILDSVTFVEIAMYKRQRVKG